MAYLHCRNCGWSQDDFWTFFTYRKWRKKWWERFGFGYNPITKFFSNFKLLWKPRWFGTDLWFVKNLVKYTGVPVKVKMEIDNVTFGKPVKEYKVFSWNWLLLELVKEWKIFRKQKWWTYRSWEKHKDTARCPQCGCKDHFDID